MSLNMPEPPDDGEAHARRSGTWIQAYGKAALDAFVEQVRVYYDGCKHYYEETAKLVANLVNEAPDDDAGYVRQNKVWVDIEDFLSGSGGAIPELEIINTESPNPLEMVPAIHTYITPKAGYIPGQDRYTVRLQLPSTALRTTIVSVGPLWTISPDTGQITSTIELYPPLNDNDAKRVVTSDGNANYAILPMRGTYHLVAVDNVWHVIGSIAPSIGGTSLS